MKKILVVFLLFSLFSCGRRMVPFFEPLKPAVKTLPNGMTLMLLEDRELPTAQVFLYIRGGSLYDPAGKEGLSSVAMQSLRLGGTETRRPEAIEEALEFVGASLEMGSKQEYSFASMALLKKDLDLGIDLLFDLLRHPALDRNYFEIVRSRQIDTLEREREDPLTLANQEYPRLIYGADSPWGRHATAVSLKQISWEDVKKYKEDFIRPDRIILAAAGDFSVDEFLSKVNEKTRDWKRTPDDLPPISPVEKKFEKSVTIIPRPDLTQSTILVGHLGDKRDNPDKYPLIVMNFILGGGGSLSSRLGAEIRSSAGKAYAVWSDFGLGKDLGIFRCIAQTAEDNTDWVVHRIQTMVREMVESPHFTDDEIRGAKQAILRSLIFGFETPFSQVTELARFRLQGYPDDYLIRFQKEIANVSRRDLERVARKHLHPGSLKVLIISNEKIAGQASAYSDLAPKGQVEVKKAE